MSRRTSLAILVPPEKLENKDQRNRRKSAVTRPTDENLNPAKNSKNENSTEPVEIKPPMRRHSTAVAPFQNTDVDPPQKNRAISYPQFRAVKNEGKTRHISSVIPPRISELEIEERGTKRKTSVVMTSAELKAVLSQVKREETNKETNKESRRSETDNRKLHSILRDSFSGKGDYQMIYQIRRKKDSIKSQDSGIVFVLETEEAFTEDWKQLWTVKKKGSGQGEIKGIKGVCFMDDGNVAVSEEKNSRIQIFERKTGKSVAILKDDSLTRRMQPAGLCQLPDRPFLAVTDLNRINYVEINKNGVIEPVFLDKHLHLHGIAANAKRHLIVTDAEKKIVRSYDIEGKRIEKFKASDFRRPSYVAVSEECSMVFVSDCEQGCVYMFSMDGELLNKIGKQGKDEENLVYPLGVCCLPNGQLIVADRGQNRLMSYDFRAQCYGHLLTHEDSISNPNCIASDGRKYLAISEENFDYNVNEFGLKCFSKSQIRSVRNSE